MILCPTELRQRYREGRLLPFIGAGVSMNVQWQDAGTARRGISWSELVDAAAQKLGFEKNADLLRARGGDLQILEYFRLRNKGHFATLNYWFNDVMNAPDDALLSSSVHERLVALERCRFFYTTNFDDFLERSFTLRGKKVKTIATEHDMGCIIDLIEVIKFHGDLNNPSEMVLSERDYEKRLAFSTAMDYRFRSDLLGRAVLFLGYSFRDWNVSYLFRLVNEQFGPLPVSPNGRRAYIVVEQPSDFEVQLFAARNMEIIPLRHRRVSDDIITLLDELVS